jgi:transposase-like protein
MKQEQRVIFSGGEGGRRRRRSRAEKDELIERWCESGLRRAEFCRREGLCYSRFLAWVKEASEGEEGGEFVEVVEEESQGVPERGRGLEVVAPNGWRICLGADFDVAAAQRLLEMVGRC